jgi:hypothetical protein
MNIQPTGSNISLTELKDRLKSGILIQGRRFKQGITKRMCDCCTDFGDYFTETKVKGGSIYRICDKCMRQI